MRADPPPPCWCDSARHLDFPCCVAPAAEPVARWATPVGIAGDAFDFRIIDHVVSPLLGKGSSYRVMESDLPLPAAWFTSFARWNQLSLMRAPRTLRDIREVMRRAEHPDRLAHLLHLIEEEAGYALYRAVSGVKAALSASETAVLEFRHGALAIAAPIERAAFESWIAPELARIAAAVDAGGDAGSGVDRVSSPATSLVPAVRGCSNAFAPGRDGPRFVSGGGGADGMRSGGNLPRTPLPFLGDRAARRSGPSPKTAWGPG